MTVLRQQKIVRVIIALVVISQCILLYFAAPLFNAPGIKNTANKNQGVQEQYIKARVLSVENQTTEAATSSEITIQQNIVQRTEVLFLEGSEKGLKKEIKNGPIPVTLQSKQYQAGDTVLVLKSTLANQSDVYLIFDHYRLDALWILAALFAILTIVVIRLKGLLSLVALGITVSIVSFYTVPQLLAGVNTLVVLLISATLIGATSLYLAHGFTRRTTLTLVSIGIALLISINLSVYFIQFAQLFGLGSEESLYLQTGRFGDLNIRGLVLAGIVIASIGVLDDVASAQAATVEELNRANPNLTVNQLYARAMKVGGEHIASMVNSLLLVFAGASLTLFILQFASNQRPLAVTINTEMVSQEIVASLIVSIGLIMTVPITTYLLSVFSKKDLTVQKV
jgi:uncharacterized membrane protein